MEKSICKAPGTERLYQHTGQLLLRWWCVMCVCVCVTERERERGLGSSEISVVYYEMEHVDICHHPFTSPKRQTAFTWLNFLKRLISHHGKKGEKKDGFEDEWF